MEPYYIACIKDGPFIQKNNTEGVPKPEAQWTPDKRRVVNHDQRLKSIIISCPLDDIMESIISCSTTKECWTDLTFTYFKTLLGELTNDVVKISKHEINVGFVNILPEKWLSFSQGLMNANHIENQDLADIYGRFVYEDYLISRRYPESKKALITASISNAFISNNVIQDFQENSDDEEDVRSSKEYLRG
ncbi:hypothetical protein Tco_1521416 [Tanacetum coccineum]